MKPAKFGFGTYRVNTKNEEHYKSLYRAIAGGISLIDTSSNYNGGWSEVLIGNVLSDLLNENKIKRDNITLVTKGGYIQGENYKEALSSKKNGYIFEDVVEYAEGLWHCIHPDFLNSQIAIQMNRLFPNSKERYIDVYLLHNPEYFLGWAYNSNQITSDNDIKTEFYSRIKKAFEFLEEKVKAGVIRYYGISSNTFPANSNKYDFVSLERVLYIAENISSDHHFKYIEFPFNLIESGAYFEKNQMSDNKTLLEYARRKKITTIVNRPLNCMTNKGVLRLVDYKAKEYKPEDLKKQIIFIANLEDEFKNEILPKSELETEEIRKLQKILILGLRLSENWNKFSSIEYFNDLVENYFLPRLEFLKQYFTIHRVSENISDYLDNYIRCINLLIDRIGEYYKGLANERNLFINNTLDLFCDSKQKNLSLAQKVLLLLRSVEGIDYILVGARKEKYTEEILQLQNEFPTDRISNYSKVMQRIKDDLIRENITKAEI